MHQLPTSNGPMPYRVDPLRSELGGCRLHGEQDKQSRGELLLLTYVIGCPDRRYTGISDVKKTRRGLRPCDG